MHNDDTGMRILRLAREPADPRTGIFTSGIVSLGPGWKIALYFSGAKYAGENLAEVLKRRPPGLAPLIQMCLDGLTALFQNLDLLAGDRAG